MDDPASPAEDDSRLATRCSDVISTAQMTIDRRREAAVGGDLLGL
jgi:hypothetical protein